MCNERVLRCILVFIVLIKLNCAAETLYAMSSYVCAGL